jgi:glycosyltransferase involved in cell wall biosynthesis
MRWWPVTPRAAARAYAAWIDAARSAAWAREAARVALTLHRADVHRAVITSGPPHMAHLAGATVSRLAGLPHVVDLRDPWSLVQRLPSALASPVGLQIARRHERRVVAAASLVIANTEPSRAALGAVYPSAARKFVTVTNGIDDDPLPPPQRSDRFRIVYAGTVYLDRNPTSLFQALRLVALELALDPRDLSVEFLGVDDGCDGAGVEALAERAGVSGFVRALPPRPRRETLAFLAGASMLVVLPQDSDLAIPAKLFEYLRFNAWLLVLDNPVGHVAQLLRGSGADVVHPRDVAAIAQLLRHRIIQHRSGCYPPPLTPDTELFRRTQAGRLVDALEAVIGVSPESQDAELCAAS